MIITKLIKIANWDNVCYGFRVKEINYKNREEKEVITINSFNEQTAGQAGRRSRAPKWPDFKKTQLNCYYVECPCCN